MSISRIELQGTVTRAQDFTTIKHNEDNKSALSQMNIQKQVEETIDHKLQQVNHSDDAEHHEKKFDAKDKSDNQYSGDGGKKRKKEKQQEEGKVIIKGKANFDIKI